MCPAAQSGGALAYAVAQWPSLDEATTKKVENITAAAAIATNWIVCKKPKVAALVIRASSKSKPIATPASFVIVSHFQIMGCLPET